MKFLEILARLNPFANRASATLQLLPFGFSDFVGTAHRYVPLATEGYQIQSVAFACIGKIIQTMQSIDWVFEKDDKRLEPKQLSPQLKILADLLADPDPWTTRNEFIAEYLLHIYIGGIAYMRTTGVFPDAKIDIPGIDPTRLGMAPNLLLERPDTVRIKTQGRQVLGFIVQTKHGEVRFDTEEMMFIRFMNPLKHLDGQSPMTAAALEIDGLNAGRKLNASTLASGGTLRSIIALKGQRNAKPEKMDEIILKFWERYADAKKEGKPMVFSGEGADFKTVAQTISELDWTSNEGAMARRVCNVFNVPSPLLGDPDTSKYSNYQEAVKDMYITNTIPNTKLLLGKYNRWLVPVYDNTGAKLVPDSSGVEVLREDEAKLVAWMALARWMTDNEKRLRQGLDEKEDDPEADKIQRGNQNNAFLQTDGDRSTRSEPVFLDHVNANSLFRTEESRKAEFDRRDTIRKRNEEKYIKELRKYFDGQRDRLIEAFINATGGKRTERQDDPLLVTVQATFAFDTFLRLNENAKYVDELNEVVRGLVVEFGQDAIDQFVTEGVLFEINRPEMQELIANDLFGRAELINKTQADTLQRIINEGFNKGLSQDEIANLITDKYAEIAIGRAKTIARTEVGRAAGIATEEGFRQAGVPFREWLTSRDEDVRRHAHSHVFMDGDVQATGVAFVGPEGEVTMTIPPTSGVAGFDINCRCVAVPLESPEDAI